MLSGGSCGPPSRGHEYGHPGEVGRDLRLERDHRPEQDRCPQETGVEQDGACRHVGPVGVADGDDLRSVEAVLFCGSFDELGQLVGAEEEVFVVEDAFGEAAEDSAGRRTRRPCRGGEDGGAGERGPGRVGSGLPRSRPCHARARASDRTHHRQGGSGGRSRGPGLMRCLRPEPVAVGAPLRDGRGGSPARAAV